MNRNLTLSILLVLLVVIISVLAYHRYFMMTTYDDSSDCLPPSAVNLAQELLPEVDIFLRMYSSGVNYYDGLLIPSLKYFWPGNLSIVVVLDGENQTDRKLGEVLRKQYPFPRVCFQGPANPKIYHGLGHQRMQRDFFYPERFTSKKYVGFIDTDTVFVTRVTRQLLFEEEKPVVIGVYGPAADPFWSESSEITAKIYKTKEVMKCMSYFPVIIKVEHIILLREYLEAIHAKSFDDIFKMYAYLPISQFSWMCQYIWMFHREEYKFYFNQRPTKGNLTWRGENNSPGRVNHTYYNNVLTPEQRTPKPRTSIHYRYTAQWKKVETLRRFLQIGLCFSGGFDVCVEFCSNVEKNSLQEGLFHFEGSDWRWDDRCLEEQRRHYAVVKTMYTDKTTQAIVRAGCQEVVNLTFAIKKVDL
ncbi:hypothetical protein ACJMK2_035774 [Sinanodonta woodiana]|uniref:Uncharacterized protein n=1 Tax=Sinanodonta woodiana TaxID=1069815 RepID=A0ABD3WG51_SINWO